MADLTVLKYSVKVIPCSIIGNIKCLAIDVAETLDVIYTNGGWGIPARGVSLDGVSILSYRDAGAINCYISPYEETENYNPIYYNLVKDYNMVRWGTAGRDISFFLGDTFINSGSENNITTTGGISLSSDRQIGYVFTIMTSDKYAIISGAEVGLKYEELKGLVIPSASAWGYVNGFNYSEDSYIHPYFKIWGKKPYNSIKNNNIYSDIVDPSTDPYDNIGTSDTGGGGGSGTASVGSDDIGIPELPTFDATDTGFITLYRPSVAELKNLANYMWSDAFSIDTFKKLFADPMDAILGLSMLGVDAPAGAAQAVTVGNFSTDVSMTKLANQYFEVNCGTLSVEEIKACYLSYSPYTKVSIYLPFIGVQQLNVDDFMSGSISLTYKFDALSGSCLALITCTKSNSGVASLNSVMYSFMGQCASTIPVNANDFSNMISSAVTIGASIAGIAATGGAAAPLAVPTMASAAVNALKPTINHSGSISGSGAILGVKTPYLIFERPRYCIPSYQNKYIGYPSFITEKISNLSGYTIFEDVKIVGNSHATTSEIAEIENILKEGVYL